MDSDTTTQAAVGDAARASGPAQEAAGADASWLLDRADLVFMVVVDLAAEFLGRDADEIDPPR